MLAATSITPVELLIDRPAVELNVPLVNPRVYQSGRLIGRIGTNRCSITESCHRCDGRVDVDAGRVKTCQLTTTGCNVICNAIRPGCARRHIYHARCTVDRQTCCRTECSAASKSTYQSGRLISRIGTNRCCITESCHRCDGRVDVDAGRVKNLPTDNHLSAIVHAQYKILVCCRHIDHTCCTVDHKACRTECSTSCKACR